MRKPWKILVLVAASRMEDNKMFPTPTTDPKGPTKLVEAARSGDIEEIRSTVAKYPDKVNITYGGFTALQKASYFGHLEIVKYLSSHGADVDMTDGKKMTPLHYAATGNKEDVIKHLLEMKANMHLVNANGQTALQIALTKKHSRCVEVFYKADPSLSKGIVEVETETLPAARFASSHFSETRCGGGCGISERVKFGPCGHQIFCFECALSHNKCTHCSSTVEEVTFDPKMSHVNKLMQELLKLRKQNEKYRQESKCSICEENRKECALEPCHHVFCSQCVQKFSDKKCPNCRKNVSKTIKLFM